MPLPAALAIPTGVSAASSGLIKLLSLLGWGGMADSMLSPLIFGDSIQGKLMKKRWGDPEEEAKKMDEAQAWEDLRFEGMQKSELISRRSLMSHFPDPQNFLDKMAAIASPAGRWDAYRTPQDSLVGYVARSLKMSPEELNARTRPPENLTKELGLETD